MLVTLLVNLRNKDSQTKELRFFFVTHACSYSHFCKNSREKKTLYVCPFSLKKVCKQLFRVRGILKVLFYLIRSS